MTNNSDVSYCRPLTISILLGLSTLLKIRQHRNFEFY